MSYSGIEMSSTQNSNSIFDLRGKQIIIAGESKRLPPTSFFAAAASDGDFDDDSEEGYDAVENTVTEIKIFEVRLSAL